MQQDDRARRARELAQARYGFLWHLPIYIVVNAGLVGIWFFTGRGFFWPVFPLAFWGLGLLGHYLGAYRTIGQSWIRRETERILREEEP